jgi:hypothetical protein
MAWSRFLSDIVFSLVGPIRWRAFRSLVVVVGPSQSERNLIHRIDPYGGVEHPKVESCPNRAPDVPDAKALALPRLFSEVPHRHSGQGAELWQAYSCSRRPHRRFSALEAIWGMAMQKCFFDMKDGVPMRDRVGIDFKGNLEAIEHCKELA